MERTRRDSQRQGFSLLELLVVISVIAILAGLLLPALAAGREKARKAACLSNLREVGIAISIYASDNGGYIPYGPKAGAFTSPLDFYPSTGAPTSLISLGSGQPVGLGLLLNQQLCGEPKVLFCPGSDQRMDTEAQLANVGQSQAQCSYYYRHAGNTQIFDIPGADTTPGPIKLDAPGKNRNDIPVRALAIDTQFLCGPGMATFNIYPSTHHQQRFADVVFIDGHTVSKSNADQRFTVNLGGSASLYSAFDLILKVLETADAEP